MTHDELYKFLDKEEIKKLNGKFKDLVIEDCIPHVYGEEGHCMEELCGDDMEIAEILICGIIRGLNDNSYEKPIEQFIFGGGMKNLAIRKYFSAIMVKEIRSKTDLSQEKFAKKVGLKPRTYQNYEEGQRIPSRLIVKAMRSAVYEYAGYVRSHRRLSLNLNLLSETSQQFLEITLKRLYHFYWYVPEVRRVSAGDHTIRMYWMKAADKWEEGFGESYMTTDYFPEDIAACIKCALEYDCDEILFEDWDKSIHASSYTPNGEYLKIEARVKEIQAELEKETNKHREHTYKLIKEFQADEATGDTFKMLKWTEGLKDYEIAERRQKAMKEAKEEKEKQKKNINRIK